MERFMARWKAESRTVAVAVCSTASRIKIQGFAARNSAAELQHHDMYLVPWHEYP
jgi:hypothetical protein